MGRRPQHVDAVESLLDVGYSVKDIIRDTNISQSTIYRVIDKLKKEARYDFKHLMEHDYLWKYQKTLQNFDLTIKECNMEISKMKNKYDSLEIITMNEFESLSDSRAGTKALLLSNLTTIQSNRSNELVKLTTQRDKATELKAKTYNQGPVVNAIDEWVNNNHPSGGELPRLKELDTLSDKSEEMISPEEPKHINEGTEISKEDLEVLKEMEKDD